ncbi:MAG: hypothetical protein ACYDGR_06940 [Candidatus Dormibacteria bacterium]
MPPTAIAYLTAIRLVLLQRASTRRALAHALLATLMLGAPALNLVGPLALHARSPTAMAGRRGRLLDRGASTGSQTAAPMQVLAVAEVRPNPPTQPLGTAGRDLSYPQCGAPVPRTAFSIIGVNHGRPFTVNPCMADEFRAVETTQMGLYLNTAFDPSYSGNLQPGCLGGPTDPLPNLTAWQVGCSEAAFSHRYAATQLRAHTPQTWWLDVEVGNSWSDDNGTNRWTVLGAVDYLQHMGYRVGLYSAAHQWQTLMGGSWSPLRNDLRDWVAGATADSPMALCNYSFSGNHVDMVQFDPGDFDIDYVCAPSPASAPAATQVFNQVASVPSHREPHDTAPVTPPQPAVAAQP